MPIGKTGGGATATVVDLFCGIGGLTHGLLLAGLNVLAGIDLDLSCRHAYEYNNGSARFICADLSSLSPAVIAALYPADGIRVLVGCAPCQPFSKYTKRYRKGEQNGGRENDDWQCDNKWRLIYSFSDIVEHIRPEIVSIENVPELATEKVFADFHCALLRLGYNVSHSVAYCPDYGVSQNRRRLVLLASLFGNLSLIKPIHNDGNYPTVRECIGDLPHVVAGAENTEDKLHSASELSPINLRRIRSSVPGGTWHDWDDSLQLKCHKKSTGQTYTSIYGRMTWDAPSPTITTQFFGYGNGRFGHPEQDRALTLREGALLQSFPPDYSFVDPEWAFNRRKVGVHIGNAVPVELGRAIGESIKIHISEANVNEQQ
ncbi:MAG: DNA cytosine methyltransferase [Deltaproteobacteria bacterium]|jgi:DNA (cytosine-5)-methyltransferase 1|nr:DNA cytosine methyltransferase [Deltaproteobacteria bacterium]